MINETLIKMNPGEYKQIYFDTGCAGMFEGELDITGKGNGTFRLRKDFLIKIFDIHDDGQLFLNDRLNVNSRDITGNGCNEIIITGIVGFTDEEGKIDGFLSFSSVSMIYAIKDGKYERIFSDSPVELDAVIRRNSKSK